MSQWESRPVAPHDAVRLVTSGMRVFVHGAAATPTPLLDALAERSDLEEVTFYHLHTGGPAPFVEPSHRGRFFSVSLFAGPPVRQAIERGDADVIPILLSDIPALFTEGHIPLDVAILQLSPPDAHG
jgi:4-hydroxybutyrate CoA-transferase